MRRPALGRIASQQQRSIARRDATRGYKKDQHFFHLEIFFFLRTANVG